MTIPRGTPQPNGEFGLSVAVALSAKGVTASEQMVIETAERIIAPSRRNGALRLLMSTRFTPTELQPETTVVVQVLLANLARSGATGIGLPLCPTCRTRKVVKTHNGQGPRECFRCTQRRSYGECPGCLRMKKLTATDADGQRVCQRCGPDGIPTFTCDDCGKTVTTVGRVDERRVCLNCFPRRLRRCASCGQQKKIAANILHGPCCFACYNHILRNAAPCPGCGATRVLAFLGGDDRPCCANCAGQPARYSCRRCGSEEHNYGRLCGKCVLSDRCDDILTGPDGVFAPPMRALRDYLLDQPRPAQIIKWLRMGPSTDVLRDIASGRVPVESVLDVPRPGKPLIYLRTLLVDAGALPRDTSATRQLMAWATQTISEAPAEHHQMLRAYTRWVLLRRASRDNSGDIAVGAARHVKASLRGLVAFLAWVEEQRAPLRGLTQAQVEEFINLQTARRWLPQFLDWAAERDITPDLDISTLPRREPSISTSEEHLEHIIRILATDSSMPLDARLASLLIAVYGLPATKTLALRRSQLRDEGESLDFLIGDRPVTLPEPIAVLAREQRDLRPDADSDAWLFPGRSPGHPLDPQYLTRRLRTLGTSVSALQNTARFRLAGAVPAKVLADMLDFSVATFENYARLAGGTRGDYPALREQRQIAHPKLRR
ncbi:MAG: hypothetical protein ACTIKQ_04660 [Microbacterium sp.]